MTIAEFNRRKGLYEKQSQDDLADRQNQHKGEKDRKVESVPTRQPLKFEATVRAPNGDDTGYISHEIAGQPSLGGILAHMLTTIAPADQRAAVVAEFNEIVGGKPAKAPKGE